MPSAGRRLRWLLAVLAVIVVLTAGWPLVSSAVAGHRPLAAGTTVTIGPSAAESGRVTVGPGWSVLTTSSNPQRYYLFSHGALRLSVRYVGLFQPAEGEQLLQGMRELLRIGHPGVRPGRPRVISTVDGRRGLTALLSGPGQTGQAAVFLAPTRVFAIEMILLGPSSAASTIRAAGVPVLQSLRFPAAAP